MSRARAVRLVVLTSLLALLMGSCSQPDDLQPTPTPVVVTPTENAQEREQRLAYEAAEKSYRDFRAELYRVLAVGGANSATPVMNATSTGPYLQNFTEVVRAYKKKNTHSVGSEVIGYVHRGGYSVKSLLLDVCEDSRDVVDYGKNGKRTGSGEVRTATIELRVDGGVWKLYDGTGKKVTECS